MKKFIFLGLLYLLFTNSSLAQDIVINEILASNTNSIKDEDGSNQDWIELYNKGSVSVNLLGYGLTDDALLLYKWTFPNVTLTPGHYLIIWASDKNRAIAGSPLHANFKISASGETILLTNPSGTNIESVPPANLQPDISFGRYPNGTGPFVFFGTPTPNAKNSSTAYLGALSSPVFSQNSGFFTSGFSLTLSSLEAGTTIIYTLDGSEPDENNLGGTTYNYKNQYGELPGQATGPLLTNRYKTLQYSNPIPIVDRSSQPNKIASISSTYSFDPAYIPANPIFKGTIVRVKTIKPGYLSSSVATKNYFISPQGNSKFSLPVVSLSLNEDRFYSYENGIYVAGIDFDVWRAANPTLAPSRLDGNYCRRDIDNEKVANMSYFVNGTEVINQDIGLRIRGGSTRPFESKSLTVYARSEYGKGALDYKFFTSLPYTSYDRLTLSNSGGDFRNTMFRDALNQQICKELWPEKEAYQPSIAFVNGEFWGILNLRERYDNNYFSRVYNTLSVDFLENEAAINEGDAINYNAMTTYVNSHSLATTANFDYIKTQLDPDSFSDFFISNIFFQNSDFPNNNVQYWRNKIAAYNPTAPYGLDGRWRWLYHDMDNTFSIGTDNYNDDTLATATSVNDLGVNPAWSTLLLRKLLENDSFKVDFINRFADLLNTSFLSSRIISNINSMKSVIYPEIPGHISRWKSPANLSDYDFSINYELGFADARPAFQRNHIRTKFGITSNVNATLNVSSSTHGYIKMNTIDIVDGTPGITGNPYPWTGIYFKSIPVKLKAIANPGFVFSNWTGASSSTNAEITITPTGNFSITANFIPNGPVETSVPIDFWMMDSAIVNGAQLTSLNSTYKVGTVGQIQYQSCIIGYPFSSGTNVSKASMERRNLPTNINYRPEANNNIIYSAGIMKGLQIKEPLQASGLENTMVFNLSTAGYKKIKFSFAAINELTNANAISIDYAINSGTPIWITTGLASTSLALTSAYQLFQSDFSAITKADNNPNFKVRLRFTGTNMTADTGTGTRITFNNIALDGIKIPLSYSTPNIFTIGTTIPNLIPSTTQTITSYSVSPKLPSGLTLNTSTGIISGTPTAIATTTIYTITANYIGGSLTFGLDITVNNMPPPIGLSYLSPNVYTKGTAITILNSTISSGTVSSYSVSPSLPSGLSLNTTTGTISGTPTTLSAINTYSVTASNLGGSTSFDLVITVNDIAPNSLSYSSPNVFTVGNLISNLYPTNSGGTVLNYSILPNLPDGLFFKTSSGRISGTPTTISQTTTYTITATNSGGSTTFDLQITVNDIAPNSLSYTSSNIFTIGNSISNLCPKISGGTVLNYSISSNLPDGLSLNTETGIISGTPTTISQTTTYTITATNSGGSTTFDLQITVNDVAPNSLSYASPNVFTVGNSISNLYPIVSGGTVLNYSISPNLPDGLFFKTSNGRISGTPTIISQTTTYTITATNSGGSTTFDLQITVNDVGPNSLSYDSPNVFTVGNSISELSPTIAGGTVLNYSILQNLPDGLSLNTETGMISGTPTIISQTTTYTITATNSGGNTTFDLQITVNDVAPNSLSYDSPNVFTVGNSISNLYPIVSGGTVLNYSISPNLPDGLFFKTSSGRISGTPTAISPTATYTVTATNSGGNTTFDLQITVNDVAPNSLSYSSPNVFTVGNSILNLYPTNSGGTVLNYSISSNLPDGLSLNTETGMISGIPTTISPTETYSVTATNSGGSTTFDLQITVNDVAPNSLSYASPNVFTIGNLISNLYPIVSGGMVLNYSISPNLPDGLFFKTSSGRISGTPTAISPTATYTVTATNSGGNTTFDLQITVNDVAPNSLSYTSPNVFTVGTSISELSPTASGGMVLNYRISPNLPDGLSLNTENGMISGTPTVVSETRTYTVTASNSGGSTTFDLQITVNDVAPNSLSYSSPNVFTVGNSISNLNSTISGGVVLKYSISPNLPVGLFLNIETGMISGKPTVISQTATYTVTASNSGGSTTFEIQITVNDVAPNSLSYTSPNIFTVGTSISELSPTVSGGTVLNYSISPNLPDVLDLNTETGIISGTPTVVSETRTYTVTALNSGGNAVFDVIIKVENPLNIYENGFSNIKIYPNPFNDIIYFYGLNSTVLYKMYAIEGKLIQEGSIKNSQIEFCDLPTGVYFLKLFSDEKMATEKIIKK